MPSATQGGAVRLPIWLSGLLGYLPDNGAGDRDSIRAFADGDCEVARTLKFKDRELDDTVDEFIERLTAPTSLESDAARSCLDLILSRSLSQFTHALPV